MKLQQLSLFIENKTGQVKAPCKILADAGINILTMTLADTEQFGILRLIVQDAQKAKAILDKANCIVKVTEVLVLEVEDQPGGLVSLLEVFEQANLAIEYMYAYTRSPRKNKAVLVFRFENPDAAIKALQARGINPLTTTDLA